MASKSHTDHETKMTTDHDTIRKWAEARQGRPATVIGTKEKGEEAGILRIDFPGFSDTDTLREITWEDFFDKFDKEKLVFLYQEETSEGETSTFGKFVSKETAEQSRS